MNRIVCVLSIALVLGFSGCGEYVLTLLPIYASEEELVLEPGIEGVWVDEEDEDAPNIVIEHVEDKAYSFRFVWEEGKEPEFAGDLSARFVRLDGVLYMNVSIPDDCGFMDDEELEKKYGLQLLHLIPAQSFVKVRIEEGKLEMFILGGAWLLKQAEEGKEAPFVEVEDRLVLTGTPKELQAFIKKCNKVEEAFESLFVLSKQKPAADKAAETAE